MAEPSCHMTVLSVKRYWLSSVISFSCSRRGGSSLKIGKFCKFFLRKRVVSITVIFLRRFNLPAMNWLRSKTGYKVYRKPWHVLIRYFCLDVILYSLLRIICLFRERKFKTWSTDILGSRYFCRHATLWFSLNPVSVFSVDPHQPSSLVLIFIDIEYFLWGEKKHRRGFEEYFS